MSEEINIEKYGNVRHLDTVFTEQEKMFKIKPKESKKPIIEALLDLERSLPDTDKGLYKQFKFMNAGENYAKNPIIMMEKIVSILEKNGRDLKIGEVRDSKMLLLQLFSLFANYYPDFVKSEPTD